MPTPSSSPKLFDALSAGVTNASFGTLNLKIVDMDITQAAEECILCPTNAELDFSKGQVAKILLAAGGPVFAVMFILYKIGVIYQKGDREKLCDPWQEYPIS